MFHWGALFKVAEGCLFIVECFNSIVLSVVAVGMFYVYDSSVSVRTLDKYGRIETVAVGSLGLLHKNLAFTMDCICQNTRFQVNLFSFYVREVLHWCQVVLS